MKTLDPQIRLRKPIAVVAALLLICTSLFAAEAANAESSVKASDSKAAESTPGSGWNAPYPPSTSDASTSNPSVSPVPGSGWNAPYPPATDGADVLPSSGSSATNPGVSSSASKPGVSPTSGNAPAAVNTGGAGSSNPNPGVPPVPGSAGILPASNPGSPTSGNAPAAANLGGAGVPPASNSGASPVPGSAASKPGVSPWPTNAPKVGAPSTNPSQTSALFAAPGKAQAAPMPAPTRPEVKQPPSDSNSKPSTNKDDKNKEDSYPSVGRMEKLTFGNAQSDLPIEDRLNKLEIAIFKKGFADLSLFDRTQQLKKTLLGNDDEPTADLDNLRVPHTDFSDRSQMTLDLAPAEFDYFEGIAQREENQQKTTPQDLKQFGLELINAERSKSGFGPLALDEVADKIAREHSQELCQRNVISHANSKGENPDRRYTVGGGTGAMTESLVSNKTPDTFSKSPTRAAVALIMKTLMTRQDDRDAILNPDATHIGFAMDWTPNKDRVIAVTEVVTNHGIIPELPHEVPLGGKLEIKGVVMQPYQFDRITLAWEANKDMGSAADEAEEALPYFPPLDYVAYAGKSQHDYSGAMSALRTAGIIAAIAGGMFMPPVALAAPLIAMSGGVGSGEPKPVSDIPIHGGVKVEGLTFSGKVPINKEGKEGIYYVTIWGTTNKLAKPVPISRRAILAKHVDEDVSAHIQTAQEEKQDVSVDNQEAKREAEKAAKKEAKKELKNKEKNEAKKEKLNTQ